MNDQDIETFMVQDFIVTDSDGSDGHPRKYGTFPKLLRTYVYTKHVLTLPKAVHRSEAHGRGTLVVRTWHGADLESVVLEIKDDGPGIPADVQPKVFDPFFTTKDVGTGTGLGLTVAYAIVQEHGGRIRLESRAGAGTSFYVDIPIMGAKVSPAPESRAPRAPVEPAAGASILVVEDEAALATAVADMLRDAGYVVENASDGAEALERIAARAFDLVICDLKMPRVDGQAFYRALATRAPALVTRVVFVTGDVAPGRAIPQHQRASLAGKAVPVVDLLRWSVKVSRSPDIF
jgi:CheY-like chemotaxis protein